MNIEVEYQNQSGQISNRNYSISRLALIKHMGVAGQRYAPRLYKLRRIIGMFLQYVLYYLRKEDFYTENRFSVPPDFLYDPTEKGQFSNLVGKAIVDFLAKRIDGAIFTANYEAAMKVRNIPISGSRPDLLAFRNNEVFAIEAKGYSGGSGNMQNHKQQSRSGPIPVNFTVASVSYNLYKRVRCKYYDPYYRNISFDVELFRLLTKKYYSGFSEFLKHADFKEVIYQNEKFIEVDLNYLIDVSTYFLNEKWLKNCIEFFLQSYNFKLILPGNIVEFANHGMDNKIKPFVFKEERNELVNGNVRIYIDYDRIGLRVEEYIIK